LLVLYSYHHKNTEKIARAMARILDAGIKAPQEAGPEALAEYDLVGFGSGIYGAEHHSSLLGLADKLPQAAGKPAFLFSTCGVPAFGFTDELAGKNHRPLRQKLERRGYRIVGEFACVGWNTNSFLKLFGGINKGRPDEDDLRRAGEFARKLKREVLS